MIENQSGLRIGFPGCFSPVVFFQAGAVTGVRAVAGISISTIVAAGRSCRSALRTGGITVSGSSITVVAGIVSSSSTACRIITAFGVAIVVRCIASRCLIVIHYDRVSTFIGGVHTVIGIGFDGDIIGIIRRGIISLRTICGVIAGTSRCSRTISAGICSGGTVI